MSLEQKTNQLSLDFEPQQPAQQPVIQAPQIIQPKASNIVTFPNWSRQYHGKSVEQVAFTDFPYLLYLREKQSMGKEDLRERILKVINTLGKFTSPLDCRHNGCGKKADKITIVSRNIPYQYDGKWRDSIHLSADTGYIWCKDHSDHRHDRAVTYQMGFEFIEKFPQYPKNIRKKLHDVLLACTGYTGTKSKQKLADHVDRLAQRE